MSKHPFRAAGWLLTLLCACATAPDALREPQKGFVGEWRASEFRSNLPEFRGTSNFAFYVYAVEVLDMNSPQSFWAELTGEFVVRRSDGTEKLPYLCYPMYLRGTNVLHAGWIGDGLMFTYAFTSRSLILERTNATTGEFFFAKLRRISREPGEPKFLPSWERNHLRNLREDQVE